MMVIKESPNMEELLIDFTFGSPSNDVLSG